MRKKGSWSAKACFCGFLVLPGASERCVRSRASHNTRTERSPGYAEKRFDMNHPIDTEHNKAEVFRSGCPAVLRTCKGPVWSIPHREEPPGSLVSWHEKRKKTKMSSAPRRKPSTPQHPRSSPSANRLRCQEIPQLGARTACGPRFSCKAQYPAASR